MRKLYITYCIMTIVGGVLAAYTIMYTMGIIHPDNQAMIDSAISYVKSLF